MEKNREENNITEEILNSEKEISLQIKKYIYENNLKKAKDLALQYQDNQIIISQLITIYIKECEYDKAEELSLKYPNNIAIIGQLIKIYIKQKRFNEAEELALRYPKDNMKIGQLITIYIRQNRLKEAEELALRYPNDITKIGQLINIYIKQKRFKEAETLALKHAYNNVIIGELISLYIEENRLKEAEELALKYPKDNIIIGLLITIYTRQNRLKEAEELALRYPNDITKIGKLITIYIKECEYDKAEKLALRYPNDKTKIGQLMTIYIKQNRLEKANELALVNQDNDKIIGQLIAYYNYFGRYTEANNLFAMKNKILVTSSINLSQKAINNLNVIRAKIVTSTIELSDVAILNEVKDEIGEEKYLFILAAIYEKLDLKSKSISIIKQIKNQSKDIKNILVTLNSKQKYFNLEKWDKLIGWFNDESEEFIKNEMSKEEKKEVYTLQTNKRDKEPDTQLLVHSQSITPTINSNNTIVVEETIKRTVNVKKVNEAKKNENPKNIKLTIYDALSDKYKLIVYKIKLNYYIKMNIVDTQKEYISKYDQLEELLLCNSDNKKAFDKVLLFILLENYKKEMEEKDKIRCNEMIEEYKNRKLIKKIK